MKKKSESGMMIVAAVGISAAVILSFFAIVRFFDFMKNQSIFYLAKNTALSAAEAGSNRSLGAIGLCPDLEELDKRFPGFPLAATGDGLADADGFYDVLEGDVDDAEGKHLGHFKSKAQVLKTFAPVLNNNPIFFVVTTGFGDTSGNKKTYNPQGETVETYAYISDSAKYQIASANQLNIGMGADLSTVTVYGRDLKIEYDESFNIAVSTTATRVGSAFYTNSCFPDPKDWVARVPEGAIVINGKTAEVPQSVQDVVFPVIEDYDLVYFKQLATLAGSYSASDVDIRGDVYPPTWNGSSVVRPEYHVKYTDGKFKIGGVTVHGQVLFVAKGGIIIDGDITLASFDTVYTCGRAFTPVGGACTQASLNAQFTPLGWNPNNSAGRQASRAHLPVLITPVGISIASDFTSRDKDGDMNQLTIQALVYCPKGSIAPVDGAASTALAASAAQHNIVFNGAMIVLDTPDFSTYFQRTTTTTMPPITNPRKYEKNFSISNAQTAPPGIPQFSIIQARFNYPFKVQPLPPVLPTPSFSAMPSMFPSP